MCQPERRLEILRGSFDTSSKFRQRHPSGDADALARLFKQLQEPRVVHQQQAIQVTRQGRQPVGIIGVRWLKDARACISVKALATSRRAKSTSDSLNRITGILSLSRGKPVESTVALAASRRGSPCMSNSVQVRLLGEFNVVIDGESVSGLNSARIQSLLAYLLLNRAVPQSRRKSKPSQSGWPTRTTSARCAPSRACGFRRWVWSSVNFIGLSFRGITGWSRAGGSLR